MRKQFYVIKQNDAGTFEAAVSIAFADGWELFTVHLSESTGYLYAFMTRTIIADAEKPMD